MSPDAPKPPTIVQPPLPEDQYFGGYAGNSMRSPVLGLPAGMSVEQAHAMNREQNLAQVAEAPVSEGLITEMPDFSEPSATPVETSSVEEQIESVPQKSRMARMLGRIGINR